MDESKVILKNAIGKIKNLMAQNKYVNAHKACLEILRFDPENIQVIKLKNKIEAAVKKHNIDALKEDIANLKPLLAQKKFEELLAHLKQLEPYINQYPPLKLFIIKAQKAYRKDITVKQKKYFDQQYEEIAKLRKQKKYAEALHISQQLIRDSIEIKRSTKLISELKHQWINDELEKKQQFMNTDKHEDILLWLQKLKQISGKHPKIDKLIEKTKQRQQLYKKDQKKDFIFSGFEKMKTLIQLKKFDKAMMAGEEVLEIDPTNTKVRKMYSEATRKEVRKINKQLLTQMKNAHKKMKEEYQKNKKDFIRF